MHPETNLINKLASPNPTVRLITPNTKKIAIGMSFFLVVMASLSNKCM